METNEKLQLCEKLLKNPPKKMGLKEHLDLLFNVYPNLITYNKWEKEREKKYGKNNL